MDTHTEFEQTFDETALLPKENGSYLVSGLIRAGLVKKPWHARALIAIFVFSCFAATAALIVNGRSIHRLDQLEVFQMNVLPHVNGGDVRLRT